MAHVVMGTETSYRYSGPTSSVVAVVDCCFALCAVGRDRPSQGRRRHKSAQLNPVERWKHGASKHYTH
jgi:hypothetical protein